MVARYIGPRKSIAEAFQLQEGYPESQAINPQHWEIVRHYRGSVGPIPQDIQNLEFLAEIPATAITRDHVRAKFHEAYDRRAILWTIVWGYPRARIGNDPDNIMKALVNAEAMADQLKILAKETEQSPLSATAAVARLSEAGKVGPSTSSKILAMARLRTKEGECVIIDQQVIASIFYNRFKEFAQLERKMMPRTVSGRNSLGERIEKSFRRRGDVYGDYVEAVSAIADSLATTPEQIERFLFRSGPSRGETKKINERWEATRTRRIRACSAAVM